MAQFHLDNNQPPPWLAHGRGFAGVELTSVLTSSLVRRVETMIGPHKVAVRICAGCLSKENDVVIAEAWGVPVHLSWTRHVESRMYGECR